MTDQQLPHMGQGPGLSVRQSPEQTTAESKPASPSPLRRFLNRPTTLSRRLTLLAFLFVMLAEVFIYVPSISRFRETWMQEKVTAAYLAVLLAEAMPGFMIDDGTKKGLLEAAGVMSIDIYRDDKKVVELTPLDMDVMPDVVVDLRTARWYNLIQGAFMTMFSQENRVMSVIAPSPRGEVLVRVLVAENPLRMSMYDYSWRIFGLSIVISTITAVLLVLALRWLIVLPVKRIIKNMLRFADDPANPAFALDPSGREDELGTAEHALSDMQNVVRKSLKQQQRLADLGTAVSKISHDLRNILATAHLLADYLQESADPNVRRIAPRVIASLDRANNLCTATMQYGKVTEPDPHPQSFPLRSLVREVSVAAGADQNNVKIQCQFDTGRLITADRDMMFRIFLNLMRNAVEALTRHKTEEPVITIKTEPVGIHSLSISIIDNGPGLPMRARENLFRPFHASSGQGGTGLGLVIARDLCEAQQGELALHKSDETGTTFIITLPQPA